MRIFFFWKAKKLTCTQLWEEEQNYKDYDKHVIFFFQLDIMEPKIPEDIYKSHLEQTSKSGVFFSMKLPIFWMSF